MENYREKWHAEVSNYVEVNKDIKGLHSDVEGMRQILQEIEKGELCSSTAGYKLGGL